MNNIDWKKLSIKELASLICNILIENGIDIVLTGGACVSIYSNNEYQSKDLDFVSSKNLKEIEKVLRNIGFYREGTHFIKKNCNWYIEFLPYPVSVGNEGSLTNFNKMTTKYGTIILLTPTDSIKDRLAAYYHWNDLQSLEQAVLIAKNNEINLKEIEKWSKKEGAIGKYKDFNKLLNKQ
jgi:hypothetical protein